MRQVVEKWDICVKKRVEKKVGYMRVKYKAWMVWWFWKIVVGSSGVERMCVGRERGVFTSYCNRGDLEKGDEDGECN